MLRHKTGTTVALHVACTTLTTHPCHPAAALPAAPASGYRCLLLHLLLLLPTLSCCVAAAVDRIEPPAAPGPRAAAAAVFRTLSSAAPQTDTAAGAPAERGRHRAGWSSPPMWSLRETHKPGCPSLTASPAPCWPSARSGWWPETAAPAAPRPGHTQPAAAQQLPQAAPPAARKRLRVCAQARKPQQKQLTQLDLRLVPAPQRLSSQLTRVHPARQLRLPVVRKVPRHAQLLCSVAQVPAPGECGRAVAKRLREAAEGHVQRVAHLCAWG